LITGGSFPHRKRRLFTANIYSGHSGDFYKLNDTSYAVTEANRTPFALSVWATSTIA
jgi:hypothetical protein